MSEPWTMVEIVAAVVLAMILIPTFIVIVCAVVGGIRDNIRTAQGLKESKANMERIRREIGEEAYARLVAPTPKRIETPRSRKMTRTRWGEVQSYNDISMWAGKDSPVKQFKRRIQTMVDNAMHLFGDMPKITVCIVDNEDSFDAWGRGGGGFVFINYDHCKDLDEGSLHHLVLHEMTHNWIHWNEIEMKDPHGKEFKDKLYEVCSYA